MTSLNSLTKLLGIGLLAAMFSCSAFVRLVVVDLRFEPPPQEFLLVVLQQSHGLPRNRSQESESSDRRNLHAVSSESSAY